MCSQTGPGSGAWALRHCPGPKPAAQEQPGGPASHPRATPTPIPGPRPRPPVCTWTLRRHRGPAPRTRGTQQLVVDLASGWAPSTGVGCQGPAGGPPPAHLEDHVLREGVFGAADHVLRLRLGEGHGLRRGLEEGPQPLELRHCRQLL